MEHVTSARSLELARPKKRVKGPFHELGDFNESIWKVSDDFGSRAVLGLVGSMFFHRPDFDVRFFRVQNVI